MGFVHLLHLHLLFQPRPYTTSDDLLFCFFYGCGCNSSYWSCYGCTGTFFYSNNDDETTVLVFNEHSHLCALVFAVAATSRVLSRTQTTVTLQHYHGPNGVNSVVVTSLAAPRSTFLCVIVSGERGAMRPPRAMDSFPKK